MGISANYPSSKRSFLTIFLFQIVRLWISKLGGRAVSLQAGDLSHGIDISSILYRCADLCHSLRKKAYRRDALKAHTTAGGFSLTTDVPILWIDHFPLKSILPGMWKTASSDAVRVRTSAAQLDPTRDIPRSSRHYSHRGSTSNGADPGYRK